MNQIKAMEKGYQSRVCASSMRLLGWSGAWLAATALMRFGPLYFWRQDSPLTLLAVVLDVAVGIGMVMANVAYLETLDELQQKVYLNALAITAGVALIAGVPFSVMGLYHVISFHAEIWHLQIMMGVAFLLSTAYGTWRYR